MKQLVSLKKHASASAISARLVEGDVQCKQFLIPADIDALTEITAALQRGGQGKTALLMADVRYRFLNTIAPSSRHRHHKNQALFTKMDRVFLNPYLGLPFFLAFLYIALYLLVNIALACQDTLAFFLTHGPIAYFLYALNQYGMIAPHPFHMHCRAWRKVSLPALIFPILFFMYILLNVLNQSGWRAKLLFASIV